MENDKNGKRKPVKRKKVLRKKRSKGMRCLISGGKLVGGIATVLIVLFGLDYLLYPCTFMRNDIHTVTTEAHQDIFLGTSHGKINIDPDVEMCIRDRRHIGIMIRRLSAMRRRFIAERDFWRASVRQRKRSERKAG